MTYYFSIKTVKAGIRCPGRRNPALEAATGTQRPSHTRAGGATSALQNVFYHRFNSVIAAGKHHVLAYELRKKRLIEEVPSLL